MGKVSGLWFYIACGLCGLCLALLAQPGSSARRTIITPPAPQPKLSFATAVAQAAPAVVSLDVRRQRGDSGLSSGLSGRTDEPRSFWPGTDDLETGDDGSGVIVTADGYVLTNDHVISGASSIMVRLNDGRQTVATVVGSDPDTDLALLKIDLVGLPFARFAPPGDIRVGDVVLAIGNPFGVGSTVTAGIISATGRSSMGLTTFENFLQTDAAINPGNSGGALINVDGDLIGISTALFSKSGGSQGIGFAIPAPLAEAVMQQLRDYGEVVRGWLGVMPQEFPATQLRGVNLPGYDGGPIVTVVAVIPNSPADLGGLRRGDIILAVDDTAVVRVRDALEYVAGKRPGATVQLKVVRRGQLMTLDIRVGRRSSSRLENS